MNDKKKYYVMGGSIIGIILVLLLSMMLLSSCTSKNSYAKIEKKLVQAAEKCINNGDVQVVEGASYTVTSEQLEQAGYIKPLSKLKDDGCSGYVTIYNNGGAYNYVPNLMCTNYTTESLKQKIIDDNITSDGDGLYAVDGEYIFKGKNPNNHLSFEGEDWLIIKIDYDGNIRLINAKPSNQISQWDTKFNEKTNDIKGESEYETSTIHDLLTRRYNAFSDKIKKHIIPTSICIGSRSPSDYSKNSTSDCSKKMDNQYLSLMNMSDYTLASYDKDCTDVFAGSCMNYNYFVNYVDESWTLNTLNDSSYEVILYQSTRMKAIAANEAHYYHDVIYVSGDEMYLDGDGSEDNPYVVK